MAKKKTKKKAEPESLPVPRIELMDNNSDVWLMLDDGDSEIDDLLLWSDSDDMEHNVDMALELGRKLTLPVYGMATEPVRLDKA